MHLLFYLEERGELPPPMKGEVKLVQYAMRFLLETTLLFMTVNILFIPHVFNNG